MKVYIIQECGGDWTDELEIVMVTTDKKKAANKLTELIKEHIEYAKDEEDWEDIKSDYSISQKSIREYVSDLVNDSVKYTGEVGFHSADEFPGGRVWCEVRELE